MTQPATLQPATRPSNATDYCDACNARAYWEITFNAGPLLFCNHHHQKYIDSPNHNPDLPKVVIAWENDTLTPIP